MNSTSTTTLKDDRVLASVDSVVTSKDVEAQHDSISIDKDSSLVDASPSALEDPQATPAFTPPIEYRHGLKLLAITVPLYMSIFLVALDRTIVATAVPRITDDFKSFGKCL